ncbi:MAG: 30S ribosome-binding factor RbfA [Tepidisphaera sp.]|nr:30S ribosome-binding factor RbfA [Tepidisphaera sp.]
MSAHKLERLAASIERAVRQVITKGLADERIRGLITVTGVKVLGDLSEAIISVSVMPEEHQELTLHGLNSAAAHVRHEVGELVETRQLPKFRFRLDRTLKKQASVLAALEAAKDDLEKRKAAGLVAEPPAEPDAEQPEVPPASSSESANSSGSAPEGPRA